jgi:uncharacterized protein YfaP (DUF2135 family)
MPLTPITGSAPVQAPQFTFPSPEYTLNETSGIATFAGMVSDFTGANIAMAVNSQLTTIGVNSGSFTAQAILRPGTNFVKFIAANELGVTASQDFEITYSINGDILFRATLTWDGPGDMDLHCVDPNGEHSYYSNKIIGTGSLDVDNVTAYGPENFTCIVPSSQAPVQGVYHVYVHYYSGSEPRNNFISLLINPGTSYEQLITIGPFLLDSSIGNWYACDVTVGGDGIASYVTPGTAP